MEWKTGNCWFFKKLFYCCSITVVCIFPQPLPHTPAKLTSLPCFHPPPWFCPCVLYSSSQKPFPTLSPPPSLLAIVRLFLISMSLVIFSLLFSFVDYVPVKGEIIWYLSRTAWLISLSIMLSSTIHAVAKGRSAFFLSAAQFLIIIYQTYIKHKQDTRVSKLKDMIPELRRLTLQGADLQTEVYLIYIYKHTHTHIYIFVYICTYINTHTYTYMYICLID